MPEALLEIQKKTEHEHQLRTVPWDEARFGPAVIKKEDDPYATYFFLHKCPCGHEMVEPRRHFQ